MTDKPDFYVEPQGDHIVLAANKRARRVINRGFEKPRPRWLTIEGGSKFLTSPEYRCMVLKSTGHGLGAALLCVVHEAGLSAMFTCTQCEQIHIVDDEQAKHLWAQALEGSEGALPQHETIQ